MKKILIFLSALLFVSLACSAISPKVIVVTATSFPTVQVKKTCLTSQEYKSETTNLFNTYLPVIADVPNLLNQAKQNKTLYLDSVWQAQMETDLTKIDQFSYAIQALKPPLGFKNSDDQLKLASIELLATTSDTRDGIHNLNITSFNNSLIHMDNFIGYIKKSEEYIKTYSMNDACP